MIDDGVEVRLQRALTLGRWKLAAEHVEVVRCVTKIVSRRDRLLIMKNTPVRGDDCRKRCEELIGNEQACGRAQCVHRIVVSLCGSAQHLVSDRRQLAIASRREAEELHGFLEGGVGRELLDGVSGDDQLTTLTVDHTQRRFGSDDSFEALTHRAILSIPSILMIKSIYAYRARSGEAARSQPGDALRVRQPWPYPLVS